MEPNKFEKKIRDKMGNREINPSQDLWNRIEDKLVDEDKILLKRPFYAKFWLGIAASILVLVSVGLYLVNDEKDGESEIEYEMVKIDENEILKDNDIEETQKKNGSEKTILPQNLKNQDRTQIIDRIAKVKNKEVLTDDSLQIEKISEPILIMSETVKSIDEHIAQLVEKVNLIENNSGALTDKEVDSLLLDAQKELFKKEKIHSTKSIDAMALLDEVEYEIDVTLKNKLFEALKKGFKEARSVVAQRNQ